MSAEGRRVQPIDAVALAVAALSVAAGWRLLTAARRHADPREALVQTIRRGAGPRDLLLFADESPELVTAAAPMPALWGAPALTDLSGVRRLYVITANTPSLALYLGRFGPGHALAGADGAMWWDLARDHSGRVIYDAATLVGSKVTGERVGGEDAGPCPPEGALLACHGPDWNRVRAEPHLFDGVNTQCVYAHPATASTLVLRFADLPAGSALVGMYGIDDNGYHPGGADVTAHLELQFDGKQSISRDLVATNRKGVTPYRIELPGSAGSAVMSIATPDAGARQFCFTFVVVE